MTANGLEKLAAQLRQARIDRGLSQRALAGRVGIPQGHLSRIENGAVDLQASSLIQLARALDLEMTLIPRRALPAVAALNGRGVREESTDNHRNRIRLNSLGAQIAELARKFPQLAILKRMQQLILELRELSLELPPIHSRHFTTVLEDIGDTVHALKIQPAAKPADRSAIERIKELESELQGMRSVIEQLTARQSMTPTPAYALDNDENSDG